MKNCIRPHYEKLKPLKSGFIENTNFENNRDPWLEENSTVGKHCRKTVGKHWKTAENIGKHLKSSDIILRTTEDPS